MKRKISLAMAAAVLTVFMGFGGAPATAQALPAPAYAAVDANTLVPKFMVQASKYYNSMGYSTNRYVVTDKELTMLAIVIHREANGESYQAKLAVGNVVMNRVLSPGYPGSTIEAVVTAPNQFSYSASTKPSAECKKAAWDVLHYETWVVPQNIYFFKCSPSKANWGRHKYWGHIGSTAFYSDVYSGRSNASDVPPAVFKRTYKWPQYGCKPAARVRYIQAMLKSFGYKVAADGWFGEGTRDAVVAFQKSKGLVADGIAGPATLRAMIKKYGVSKLQKLMG